MGAGETMQKAHGSSSTLSRRVSRRQFLGHTAAVAFSIVPRRVLGGSGYVAPSDKINIAFVGVGSQGFRVMLHFLREPDVQGVAVCDPNRSGANHPQWYTHEFCNSVRDLLGVKSGWDWLSPDDPIQLQGWSSKTRKIMPVGQDTLDWKKIFTAARAGGVQNYFVEMQLDMMRASVPYLRKLQVD